MLPKRVLRVHNIFVSIPTWSKSLGDGLFELRLKGAEGIARVFFCTLVGKRVLMLHSFVKKSDKTPKAERKVAEARLGEVKDANA